MVQFYDYSDGYPETWAWNFGDGTTSTEQNPVHTYAAAGVYDVALTITNPVGTDTAEEAGYITVTNPMTVDFSASQNTGYAPLTVTFTDRTTSSPTAWLWDFGDGATSTKQHPVHTYERAGAYAVSLTATNAYGSITEEKVRFVIVTIHTDGGDSDDPTPFVTPTPTPTPLSTPVATTARPTPTAAVTVNPTPAVAPTEFIGTARLPAGPDGAVERTVTIWADDLAGYLTIDAGVVARDGSGMLQETIRIVAVPVTSVPSPGDIGHLEHPRALYAFDCSPDGVSFSPAITLTFVLSEDEWERYGNRAEAGWFNSTSGAWERVPGTADANERTITIQVSHFSTWALFAEAAPEVPLPDMTKPPSGSPDGSAIWLWGILIAALAVVGYLAIRRRKEE
ncbi:PKD domain-containing protein [Methanogenium sp. S4BF]|nr:PKD domain-containing protein [Methanogenium sp. S4BF]